MDKEVIDVDKKTRDEGAVGSAIGGLTMLVSALLVIVPISLIPKQPSCDACAGSMAILGILAAFAIGAVGGIAAIILGIVGLSKKPLKRDNSVMSIALGIFAIFTPLACWALMASLVN